MDPTLAFATADNSMMLHLQAQSAYDDAKKSVGIAYAFWFFLGVFGAHRFYLGQAGVGLLMLFTLGGFGFIVLLDLFILGLEVKKVNARRKAAIFGRAGLPVLAV
jgi:TM2 domain-containing membrane protein YozV